MGSLGDGSRHPQPYARDTPRWVSASTGSQISSRMFGWLTSELHQRREGFQTYKPGYGQSRIGSSPCTWVTGHHPRVGPGTSVHVVGQRQPLKIIRGRCGSRWFSSRFFRRFLSVPVTFCLNRPSATGGSASRLVSKACASRQSHITRVGSSLACQTLGHC